MAMYGPYDPYGQPGQNPPPNPQQGQPDNYGQTPYDPQYPPADQQGYPDQYSSPPNYDPASAPPVFDAQQPPPGGAPPYGPPPPGGPPGPPSPYGPQPPPKKGNGLLWALLAGGGALVLVVAIVVVVSVFFLSSDDEDPPPNAEESTSTPEPSASSQDDPTADSPSPDSSNDPFAGYAEDDPIRGKVGDCVYAWSTGGSTEYDAKLVDCDDPTANATFYDKATGTLDQTKCPDHANGKVEFWYWVDMPSSTSDDYVLCGYWTKQPN